MKEAVLKFIIIVGVVFVILFLSASQQVDAAINLSEKEIACIELYTTLHDLYKTLSSVAEIVDITGHLPVEGEVFLEGMESYESGVKIFNQDCTDWNTIKSLKEYIL